jgi:hypothetical protein
MSPTFIVQALTRYMVQGADTPERVLAWFNDPDDIDLDTSTIEFADVQVLSVLADDADVAQSLAGVA